MFGFEQLGFFYIFLLNAVYKISIACYNAICKNVVIVSLERFNAT